MGRGGEQEKGREGEQGLAYKTKSKFFNKKYRKKCDSYQSLYLHILYTCSPNRYTVIYSALSPPTYVSFPKLSVFIT